MPRSRLICFLLLGSCLAVAAVSIQGAEPATAAQLEFFEAKIRPVLIDQCYECHNSAKTHAGGLALDSREGLLKGGDSGPALVPGKPQESLLIQVLRHQLEGYEMPKSAPALSEETIVQFENWIRQGAADPRLSPPTVEELAQATSWEVQLEKRKQWWSFQPIRNPAIPSVSNVDWCQGDVDRFLLSRLEAADLHPGPDAAAPELVRRVFYVLTGLPPAPEELARWQSRLATSDRAARNAALGQLVDDLLARPQFGEHWARHWMDWIRYAESHGSEGDPDIGEAWRYRDYLIRAFNTDLRYNQLLREHIAGDLLEHPRINDELQINESLIGTAHWRMVFHGFTPTDALDEKVRFIDDEINVFSKAFQGLTISCARCHNHKFDAISQADYYAIFGILGSCRPGRHVIDLPEVRQRHTVELVDLKQKLQRQLAQHWHEHLPQLTAAWFSQQTAATDLLSPWFRLRDAIAAGESPQAAWERELAQRKLSTLSVDLSKDVQASDPSALRSWNFAVPEEANQWFRFGQGLAGGSAAAGEFAVSLQGDSLLEGIYPAGLYTHGLSTRHGGLLMSPAFPAAEGQTVWLKVCGDGKAIARYVVQQYPRAGTVYPTANPGRDWRWVQFDLSYWNGEQIYIELETPRDAPIPFNRNERAWFGIREARIARKDVTPPAITRQEGLSEIFAAADGKPISSLQDLESCYQQALHQAIVSWQQGTLTDTQADLLDRCLQEKVLTNSLNALPELQPLVERYRRLEEEIPVPQTVPGLQETEAQDQQLFVRGDHHHPAESVPRRYLESLGSQPYSTAHSGRRQLAEELLADDNPLTRRVIVNRIWHHLFGEGLVRSPDNFGKMGETPTHPELLDWLAVRFSTQDWSFKKLIRELVLSHAWQLDSTPGTRARETDPENRLLSHATVRRLEAEAVRDSLLMVAGKLDVTQFGPPVPGESPRRSVYVAVRRNSLDPFLRAFDFPEPFSATGRRDVTNVPAQALTLMNDPRVLRDATAWAQMVLQSPELPDDAARINDMFLTALGRPAEPDEQQRAEAFLTRSQEQQKLILAERDRLQMQLEQTTGVISQWMRAANGRLKLAASQEASQSALQPVASWEFGASGNNRPGQVPVSAVGEVKFENDAAVIGGGHYLITEPLPMTLREKTLEAWVQLETFAQPGAGVISLQTRHGDVFDAIVFGEMEPNQWLAGSNFFRRTKSFQGPPEIEATDRPVHLAITYGADGRVTCYRDGVPYGTSYQNSEIQEFPAGESVITLGLRHLPAGGNRTLSGRIFRARVFNRALTPEEVRLSWLSFPRQATEAELQQVLTADESQQLQAARQQRLDWQKSLAALPAPSADGRLESWTDLARAIFLMKEFLYLR